MTPSVPTLRSSDLAGLLGKAINHAEAKARALALRLRREERLEHTIDDGRIDTGPGVAHRDHDVLPRHRIGVALAVLAVERHVAGFDDEFAAVRQDRKSTRLNSSH